MTHLAYPRHSLAPKNKNRRGGRPAALAHTSMWNLSAYQNQANSEAWAIAVPRAKKRPVPIKAPETFVVMLVIVVILQLGPRPVVSMIGR